MKLEVVELVRDNANEWLRELFEYVIEALSPKFERIQLVIAETLSQARSTIFQGRDFAEVGATGLVQEVKPIDNELTPWKGYVDSLESTCFLIVKPQRIRELALTYEEVTEGMAHEVSEGIILEYKQNEWTTFSEQQVALLARYHTRPDVVLALFRMIIRERLADKYSAEHGFGREILSCLTQTFLSDFVSSLPKDSLTSESKYPWLASVTVYYDKSVSLAVARKNELAEAWMEIWQRYIVRKGKLFRSFFDYYKKFRLEFLSMPLTADSLLVLYNVERALNL